MAASFRRRARRHPRGIRRGVLPQSAEPPWQRSGRARRGGTAAVKPRAWPRRFFFRGARRAPRQARSTSAEGRKSGKNTRGGTRAADCGGKNISPRAWSVGPLGASSVCYTESQRPGARADRQAAFRGPRARRRGHLSAAFLLVPGVCAGGGRALIALSVFDLFAAPQRLCCNVPRPRAARGAPAARQTRRSSEAGSCRRPRAPPGDGTREAGAPGGGRQRVRRRHRRGRGARRSSARARSRRSARAAGCRPGRGVGERSRGGAAASGARSARRQLPRRRASRASVAASLAARSSGSLRGARQRRGGGRPRARYGVAAAGAVGEEAPCARNVGRGGRRLSGPPTQAHPPAQEDAEWPASVPRPSGLGAVHLFH